jgi:hypothetical protein
MPQDGENVARPATRPWMPPSAHRALAERLAGVAPEDPPHEPARVAPAPAERAVEAHRAVPRPVSPPLRAVEPQRPPDPAAPATRDDGRRWFLPALFALVFLLAVGGVGWLAYDNKTRADAWEARAFRLERNTEQLNGLLIERSTQLNERTREVNQIAKKFARQQSALNRSESDVASLSERQRELAAEKAAVEDSRASLVVQSEALGSVASELVACNDGLVELLGYLVSGNSAAVSDLIDGVAADCDSAELSFAEYRSRYG